MFRKKIFSTLILFFLFCVVSTFVSADTIEKQTTTLDLKNQATIDNIATKGWKWNNDTKTLTLKNANFETTDYNKCIILPENCDVTIEFEGNNTLKAQKATVIYGNHNSNLTLKGINGGTLNLDIEEIDDRGEADNIPGGNTGSTLSYVYNLNIESGTINSNGQFFSIDNTFTMNNGNLNIDTENMVSLGTRCAGIYALNQVKINGGNLNVKANGNGILVTGAGDSPAEDGIIINGGNISVSSQGPNLPTIASGLNKSKNIVINGGNITLAGDYGIGTIHGNILLNKIDSLNADKVKNKDGIIKVSSNDAANKIVYGEADYSKVDEAINKAKKLNKDDYIDFSAVEKAISSVVRGKTVLEQKEVDAMGNAINNAIASLKLKEKEVKDDTPKTGVENENAVIPTIISIVSLAGIILLNITNYYKNNNQIINK